MSARTLWILICGLLLIGCCERSNPAPDLGSVSAPAQTEAASAASPAIQPEPAFTPQSSGGVSAPRTVTWYVLENQAEQSWQRETVIPAFEAHYPGIKIRLVVATWDEFEGRLLGLIAAGSPPDIWSTGGPGSFANYQVRGLVADLTPYIERAGFDLSDFNPSTLESYTIAGRLYGLPATSTGAFIFYNKDLFDAAGVAYPPADWDDRSWTWEAFLQKCAVLTRSTGQLEQEAFGCDLAFWPNDSYAWLWGQALYPETAYPAGLAGQILLTEPATIAAFQARQDLVWKYHYMPTPAQSLALSARGGGFAGGQVAMYLTGGWGWTRFKGLEARFNWGVAALPFGNDQRQTLIYTYPWLMSSRSQNPEQAWTFLSYLASPEVQRSWMELTGAPPARDSLVADWASQYPHLTLEEVSANHLGALRYGQETPNHRLADFEQINAALNACLAPVIENQGPAAELLPACMPAIETVLQEINAKYK